MASFNRWALAGVTVLASAAGARAQVRHAENGGKPAQLGSVTFPTSCNATAQRQFERGMALLHSFWYEEAGKTFKDVVVADSSCAMGYWGLAMAVFHPLWPPYAVDPAAGLAAAGQAVRLARTPRERDYARAIAAYYRDYANLGHEPRLIAFEQVMDTVQRRYPTDTEARILYALALIADGQLHPSDTTFAKQKQADAILEPLFQKEPKHPGLAHYLIHANDSPPLAKHALDAAQHYAGIAPSVPHARHMPSHIFTRLGMWDEDIASNQSSSEAAAQYEQEQHLNGLWDQHGHAMDYLEYAYLQEGRDGAAREVVDAAAGITAVFPPNSLTNDYALAAIPARYLLERGRWAEASKLAVRPAPAWRGTEGLTHFARAIGAARSGDTALARSEIAALADLEGLLVKAGGPQAYWSGQVKIQRLAASAWLARGGNDAAEAIRLATEAADLEDVTEKHPVTPGPVLPARELEGDLRFELGKPAQALRAYQATLARSPGRPRSLFGAARAAELVGDRAAARASYQAYLKVTSKGDGARPEAAAARSFLAQP
jgi:hypothetical protein